MDGNTGGNQMTNKQTESIEEEKDYYQWIITSEEIIVWKLFYTIPVSEVTE